MSLVRGRAEPNPERRSVRGLVPRPPEPEPPGLREREKGERQAAERPEQSLLGEREPAAG
ncbi:MAG: hypothetical protein DMF49_12045 [Acidobacteria bacterium]|nr:MAG: hypothetical protein DMF49_12045 [Acidobacteriota bacterium]